MVSIGVFVRFRVEDGSMGAVEAKKNGKKTRLFPPLPRSTRRVGRGVGERERERKAGKKEKFGTQHLQHLHIPRTYRAGDNLILLYVFTVSTKEGSITPLSTYKKQKGKPKPKTDPPDREKETRT